MTRFHLIKNQRVPFTAEEETARDAEEQAWRDGAFDRAMKILRQKRNELLVATDFYALSDVTMSEDMTNYRQALRDIPSGISTVEEAKAISDGTIGNNYSGYPTKP